MKNRYILIVNAGSVTLKMAVFTFDLKEIISAQVEKIGEVKSIVIFNHKGKVQSFEMKVSNHSNAFKYILNLIDLEIVNNIYMVGHRVVHGGTYYSKPVKINKNVIDNIRSLFDIAPLHNPINLDGILIAQKMLSHCVHYAVFDTAFHHTIPDYAYTYSISKEISSKYAIRKYGFHGTSHQYCLQEVSRKLNKPIDSLNIITIHLGNGASITAIKNGKSIDTSMGFTPLEGLTMGTRSGDLDPGIIFYLLNKGINYKKLYNILNKESGVKGLFGSQDMRDILITAGYKIKGYKKPVAVKGSKKEAQLALDIFVYDILRYVHSYMGLLKNIDAITFTGGIGERNADIRKLILQDSNYKGKVLVIPANEELMMARLITNKK